MTIPEVLAIFIWLAVVVWLFITTTPRRAVLIGLVGGWLFLPTLTIRIAGPLPDLTKASITGFSLVGLVLLRDRKQLRSLRPRWFDVPMLVWCAEPFVTALVNREGVQEAISAVSANVIVWGIPYLLGRLYLQDAEGWRELARAIFVGGLAYVPLCWFEIIAGPRLAWLVYGYVPDGITTAFRFGGWRPVVFMAHGLMVALWMTAATVSGFWLWLTGLLPRVRRIPTWVPVLVLFVTTIALKSVNGWVLVVIGIGILWLSTRGHTTLLAWGTLALILLYLGIRASGVWNGQELIALTDRVLPNKTNSIAFRLDNEQRLAARARQAPLWGWGRFGRNLPPRVPGVPKATTDSLWIIAFGQAGIVGLVALYAFLLLPLIFLLRRVPVDEWVHPLYAPAAALSVILLLYAIDNLANAMPNPIYLLAAGGLLTLPQVAAQFTRSRAMTLPNAPLSTETPSP